MSTERIVESADSDGCGSCLSRRGVITGALAVGGTALAGSSPAAAGTQSWHTVCRRNQVAVGGGLVVSGPGGQPLIITRPGEDAFRAFTAICPHQGCSVSGVRRRRIYCGCHGSEFSMRTGDVFRGPATGDLERFPVRLLGRRVQVWA